MQSLYIRGFELKMDISSVWVIRFRPARRMAGGVPSSGLITIAFCLKIDIEFFLGTLATYI